jgi:protein ImuA
LSLKVRFVMQALGKREVLAGLRTEVQRMERGSVSTQSIVSNEFSLLAEGGEANHLPSPLDKAALHEVRGAEHRDRPAAFGFLMALIARAWDAKDPRSNLQDLRPLLWCEQAASALDFGTLYGPGLRAFGLDPSRFIVVRTKSADELLWAMEEGVRCGGLSGVVGAFGPKTDLDLRASRRLQLAAERTGTMTFFLRQPTDSLASVARTRWVIGARPSRFYLQKTIIGLPRWQVSLDKCRAGRPGTWDMEWDYAAHHFRLAAPLVRRPVLPEQGGGGNHRGSPVAFIGSKRGGQSRSAA